VAALRAADVDAAGTFSGLTVVFNGLAVVFNGVAERPTVTCR